MASDESKLESVFLAMLSENASLAALVPRQHLSDEPTFQPDAEGKAKPSLSVTATKLDAVYERVGTYNFHVRIELASNNPDDASELDALSAAIDSAIPVQPGDTTSVDLSAFEYLRIENEIECDRPIDTESRSRVRTYPVLAQTA